MLCDLHVHSSFSDGTDTPAQLIRQAESLGLSALALCDHNTLSGLPDFLAAAKDSPVEAIAGIEFSTSYQALELHILALGLQESAYAPIQALLADSLQKKEVSNRQLVENLRAVNIYLDYDALKTIKNATPNGKFNRAHIAAELTALGVTPSIKAAFSTLLHPKNGLYSPPKWPEPTRIISFIRDLNAIPVLAHPLVTMDAQTAATFLEAAVHAGLIGMETCYSRYDAPTAAAAQDLAARFGLLPSGGSDYHGRNKPDVLMAGAPGAVQPPLQFWQQMQALL